VAEGERLCLASSEVVVDLPWLASSKVVVDHSFWEVMAAGGSDLSGRWWRGKWPNPLHWSCEGRRVGEDVKIQFSSKRQVFFTESTNSLRLCRKMTPGELVQWCRTNLQYR
jgi:hypothetical protein